MCILINLVHKLYLVPVGVWEGGQRRCQGRHTLPLGLSAALLKGFNRSGHDEAPDGWGSGMCMCVGLEEDDEMVGVCGEENEGGAVYVC